MFTGNHYTFRITQVGKFNFEKVFRLRIKKSLVNMDDMIQEMKRIVDTNICHHSHLKLMESCSLPRCATNLILYRALII